MTETHSLERASARAKKYPEHAFADYERIIIERSDNDTAAAAAAAADGDRPGKRSQERSLTFEEWHSRGAGAIPLGAVQP